MPVQTADRANDAFQQIGVERTVGAEGHPDQPVAAPGRQLGALASTRSLALAVCAEMAK